jgi:hypothetical protein
MIERFLAAVQRGIAGLIGVLVLVALLVGLVFWARDNPEALQALVGRVIEAAVSLVSWLLDQIVQAFDRGGE